MTKDETKQAAAVMMAWCDGKVIQCRRRKPGTGQISTGWFEANTPCWNWDEYEYRIKPDLREVWVRIKQAVAAYTEAELKTLDRSNLVHMREVIE